MPAPEPPPSPSPHRWRWLGFAGSLLLAISAAGAGVYPRPGSEWPVRLLPVASGQPWLTIFVGTAAAGVAVLVAAWWLAGRTGRLEPRWVAATAALWAMPLVLLPPLFSRDVYSYAAQGDVLAHGLDPYTDGPADVPSQWLASISPTWADTPAPYGPLFLQLAHLAVRVSAGYLPAVVLLLRLVAIAGVLLVAVYLPRLARACGTDPGRALWLGLASPLLITHFVSGAHNDALMVGLIVAGLAYAAERNGFAAAVAIALAAAVKAPALATLPFAALLWAVPPSGVQRRPVKAAALTAGTAAATFAAVTAATGLGTGWIGAALDTPGASVQWTSVPTAIGIAAGWVTGPAAAGTALATARTIGTLLTVIAIAALIWRAWRNRDDTRVIAESAGLALLAAVVLAPAFHPWYLLWAAVPLAASARRTQALAIASAALCFLVLPDGYNLARSTEVPGVLLVLATLVTLTVLAVRRRAGVGEEPVTAGAAP